MPSYVIEFDSSHGPERRLFTLDDDRTLDVQLYQVLEELRENGRVLHGAPGDELAALWNGQELDLHSPLGTLGVTTARPLVLRMRPKPVVVEVKAVVRPRYGLRHMLLPPLEGALGALAAWAISGLFTDLGGAFGTVDRLDIVVAVILAGAIGLALSLGSTMRGLASAPMAMLFGVLSAAAGALVFVVVQGVADAPTVKQFLLARMGAWLLIAIPVALLVTAPLRELGRQRFAEAAAIGACAGLLGALIASLPGVSELWQAVAFIVCGALIGGAAVSIPVWRTSSASAA